MLLVHHYTKLNFHLMYKLRCTNRSNNELIIWIMIFITINIFRSSVLHQLPAIRRVIWKGIPCHCINSRYTSALGIIAKNCYRGISFRDTKNYSKRVNPTKAGSWKRQLKSFLLYLEESNNEWKQWWSNWNICIVCKYMWTKIKFNQSKKE